MRYLLFLFLVFSFVSPAWADCTNPAGAESATRYDFTAHKLHYCNGTSWMEVGSHTGGGTLPGALCGLAVYSGNAAGCLTYGISFSAVASCEGASVVSTCPGGYTQIVWQTGQFSTNVGMGTTTRFCSKSCVKN